MEILLPLLRIKNLDDMRTKIIRIGNSLGIIIPAKILKKLSLQEKDTIAIEMRGPRLIIESAATKDDPFAALPKTGWFSDSRDSWAIAEELHDSRVNNREVIEL
ncbi:MAG: AbrB/MazE/SpoVT family DNA-binding domain-containing protein [Bacteroidales bacterium]|nr:AbrB/MazE/SpoVT family DNA-binding domain-containing protein [Bacteroidales bacterium]